MARGAVLFIIAFLVAGCGVDQAVAVDRTAPDVTGPYAIGVTETEIDDGSPLHRMLPVEIWYPAAPTKGAPTEVYKLMAHALLLAELPSPLGAVRDAPAATSLGPRPVVVFSHGNGGVRIQSLFLTEHLASHGFVVAAPDHVGNTMAELLNGSALPALDVAKLRPGDISAALDAVLAANTDPESPIHGAADPSRVAVAGHSFGAYTTLRIAGATVDPSLLDTQCNQPDGGLLCEGWAPGYEFPASQRDPRFTAAVAQAPGGADIVGDGFEDVAIPTLVLDGTVDRTTPWKSESLPAYERLPTPSELVIVDGAGHFSFSNMCELVDILSDAKNLFGNVFDDGCGPDNIPPEEAQRITNGFTTAFLERWLQGRPDLDSWLDARGPPPAGVAVWRARP